MYESFYHLQANPFRLTPDPSYCYIHSGYKMAHEYLEYALTLGEGSVMVTGRPGTGKTTLAETFLQTLDMRSVTAARIAASNLDSEDLLRTVAYAYKLDAEGHDKATLRHLIQEFFEEQVASGHRVLLIIDEAQGLPRSALEELRLLADLQANSRQLLQLFLVGQETLREQMSAPEMEHFQQRVIASYHLVPLGLMETKAYVEYRLRQAGWQGDPELSGAAVLDIYRFSSGVPRHINKLCNRLLLLGYGEGSHKLDGEHVQAIANEMGEEQLQPMASESSGGDGAIGAADIPEFESGAISLQDLEIRVKGRSVIGSFMATAPASEIAAQPSKPVAGPGKVASPDVAQLHAAVRKAEHISPRRLPAVPRWRVKLASSMVMLTVATLSIAAVTSILDKQGNPQVAMLAVSPDLHGSLPTNNTSQQMIASLLVNDMTYTPEVQDYSAGTMIQGAVQAPEAGHESAAVEAPEVAEQVPVAEVTQKAAAINEPGAVTDQPEPGGPQEQEIVAPQPATIVENEVPVVDPRAAKIEKLLAQGNRALKKYRLLTPAQDNAHHYFKHTLRLDPDNAAAHAGIEQIVERYKLLAHRAIAQQDEIKAERYISRGLSIEPDDGELLALQQQSRVPIVSLRVEAGEAPQKKEAPQKIGEFFSRVKTFFTQQQ